MERAPKENRFEFVVLASQRARQLLNGRRAARGRATRRSPSRRREILRRKVVKIDDAQ